MLTKTDWNNYSPTRAIVLRWIILYNLPLMLIVYLLYKFGIKPPTSTDKQLFTFLAIISVCSTILYILFKDIFQ